MSGEDHEWLGWNSAPDGNGTSYTNQQSVKNLTTTANGVYTLYAQWRAHETSLSVEKTCRQTVAHIGDTLIYDVKVTNNGDATLKDVLLTDELVGISEQPIAETLGIGESVMVEVEYDSVSIDDAMAREVTNTASASATSANERLENPMPATASVSVPVKSQPKLSVTKTVDSACMESPHVGDELTYQVTVSNDGDIPLDDINVIDTMSNGKSLVLEFDEGESFSLFPGQSAVATATYSVTQDDIDTGALSNTASGTATDPSCSEIVQATSEPVATEVVRLPSLTLAKAPAPGKEKILEGQSASWVITATNTGNVSVYDVTVNDPLLGIQETEIADKLLPGETATFEATGEPVSHEQALTGYVENVAFAHVRLPQGCPAMEEVSATAKVDVTPMFDVSWIDDLTGEVVKTERVVAGFSANPLPLLDAPRHSGYVPVGYDSDAWEKVDGDTEIRVLYDWDVIVVPATGSTGMLAIVTGIVLVCIAGAAVATVALHRRHRKDDTKDGDRE